jgi:vitamin B12 transporter
MAFQRNWRTFAAAAVTGSAWLPAIAGAQGAGTEPTEEIIVTSSIVATPRRQLATAVSVIDGPDIELRGYSSLADTLRTQPGIGVTNTGGPGKSTTLRIRGEDGFRTLLMIDGVKALDPSTPQVGPSFDSLLTTSDLTRVEVLRGPQGFIYGADSGGVVNVLTARGDGPIGARVGIEYGAHDTRKLDAGLSGSGDRGDYFVSVTDLETDGFNAQTVDTVLRDNDGADNTTLHAKLGWDVAENLRLQLVARDVDASALFDNCFHPVTFATVHDCRVTTDQTTFKASAELESGAFTHSFGASHVDIARDNFAAGASYFATDGGIGRFEYTGAFRPSDSLTLVYGADLQREEMLDGAAVRDRGQDGYYVEYQGAFDDRFFLSLGARYDDNEDFGSHTSSRLSAAYVQDLRVGGALKYRASVGTGFRAPSLFEIAYNAGPFSFPPAAGLALGEESSGGYDVGVEYDATGGLHLEATYFDQDVEDEIFFDLVGFSGYLQSVGTSESKGVELGMTAPVGERWQILANWTHNHTSETDDARRLRCPKTLGNLGLSYTSPDDALRLIVNYRVSRDAIDIGGAPLDDYGVLDVSLAYSVSDAIELHARVQNAADEAYEEVAGYNTAGRSVYAGVRLRFR